MKAHRSTGRPRRSDEELRAMRKRITSVARELFLNEGFESVSIRRLMGEVELSPMMFYQFFPHKRAVLRHIRDDIFQKFFETCERSARRARTPEARLRAYITAAVRFWLKHPDNYRVIYMYEDRIDDGAEAYFANSPLVREGLRFPYDLLQNGVESGHFRAGDPQLMLQSAIVQIHGLAHSLITIPEFPWRAPRSLVEHTVDGFVKSLSP